VTFVKKYSRGPDLNIKKFCVSPETIRQPILRRVHKATDFGSPFPNRLSGDLIVKSNTPAGEPLHQYSIIN
jgi:hypothetical protein